MLIDFNNMQEIEIEHLDGGEGAIPAKMLMNEYGKVIVSRIPPKCSIGLHSHKSSNDINFVISGTGRAICDGEEEVLTAGTCHYCRIGQEHSIINDGDEDLVLYTVVQNV